MADLDIPRQRLINQGIAPTKFDQPGQVVAWMGAMQAQDYPSARWAVGLRCQGATQASIERAIADQTLLRTWLLRGTLHFVAPDDVRWMLALLAPRLIAQGERRNRQLALDEETFNRSFNTLTRALDDDKRLTRPQAFQALEAAGISTAGQRGYHILQRAALEGLICFGPHEGKQDTFVLLDDWAAPGKRLEPDQALAELAGRYFASHGPATLADFTWWSGLAAAEARSGLELFKAQLRAATTGDQTYWMPDHICIAAGPLPSAHLLPAFDEYFLGYTHRDAVLDPRYDKRVVSSNGVFRPMLVIDGQVVGVWKKEEKKEAMAIQLEPFRALNPAEMLALEAKAEDFGEFLGQQVRMI
jgi:hypothetical protein